MSSVAQIPLESAVHRLARARGEIRSRLCRAVHALCSTDPFARLGFRCARDYADERLGRSARELQDLARVGRCLGVAEPLDSALRSGTLPWSKVRLLARIVEREFLESNDGGALDDWVAVARRLSCSELAERLKTVKGDRAVAAGRAQTVAPTHLLLSPLTYAWWARARQLGRRRAGRELSAAELIDLVLAETGSAFPVEECPTARRLDLSDVRVEAEPSSSPTGSRRGGARPDPFALDALLRDLVASEERIDAALARQLTRLRELKVHRTHGFTRFADYVREVLGIRAHRLKLLLRIDRACASSRALARAYRTGRISSAKADVLRPVLTVDGNGRWDDAWIDRARRVTLRRLRSDVEHAELLLRTEPSTFHRSGGIPAVDDPVLEREVDAHLRLAIQEGADAELEAGAELCVPFVFWAAASQRDRFRAVLEAMQKRLERERGETTSIDLAFRALLAHACVAWGELERVPWQHRIYARDGYRCQVPGCSSRGNLEAHHIQFASHGGPTVPWNLVTLCAAHHHLGVHRGRISVKGRAPERLRFSLGTRTTGAPLAVFLSGDRVASVH